MKALPYISWKKWELWEGDPAMIAEEYGNLESFIRADYRVRSFLVQPFAPEKIPDLFVGWEYVEGVYDQWHCNNNAILIYPTPGGGHEPTHYKYVTDLGAGLKNPIGFGPHTKAPSPETLNDFIRDCQRAGIYLEWNTENPEIKKTFGL